MTGDNAPPARSLRVLVLAPKGRDGAVLAASLHEAGIEPVVCSDVESMCACIPQGAGALLIAQEALAVPGQQLLRRCLGEQPPWSMLPLVILTMPHVGVKSLGGFLAMLGPLGTATIVERPIKPATLQSVLRMVLLLRERQYELGDHLAEIERQRAEIARHRDNLQTLIEERTAELRESLRKTQDAQRLAALGNMAAGIGHDIANMTLPIRIRLEPLAAATDSPEARQDIEAIGKSLDHLSNLSAGLRLMALAPERDSASVPALDLRKWKDQAEAVLRNALPRGVAFECHVSLDEPLPGVSMSSHRLTQTLFNLVQNAGEAIAASPCQAGTVRLSIRTLAGQATGQARKGVVEFVVSDDGPGIAAEHLPRLFEPYFTTKSRAIATGMGLGMVRGLVESAGGTIEVESSLGHGATFRITLPAVAAAAASSGGVDAPDRSWTAVIALPNARQQALSEAILRALNVDVLTSHQHRHQAIDVPNADLWVTSDPSPHAMQCFLSPGADRRVVIVVARSQSDTSSPSLPADDRVLRVPETAGPAALRDALVSVVRSFPSSRAAASL